MSLLQEDYSWPVVESDDGRSYVAMCGDPKCDLAYEHERFVCSGICNGFEGYVPEPYVEDEYR